MTPYRLTVCGIDELPEHASAGVTHVISLLDPEAPVPHTLQHFPELRRRWVLRFHDVGRGLPGTRAPEAGDVTELLAVGEQLRFESDGHVLVHCHAGVSRSTAAAAILMAREAPGEERAALDTVARLRPIASPNARMLRLADETLARAGALTRAYEAWLQDRLDTRHPLLGKLFGR